MNAVVTNDHRWLMALSVAMLGVMSLYVIPQFEQFFSALNVELPGLTRWILGVSLFVRTNWLWLLAGILVGAYLLSQWSQTRRGRVILHRTLLQVPFVGAIVHRFALSQFTRSLATLLEGGIREVFADEMARLALPPERLAFVVRVGLHGLVVELSRARSDAEVARVDRAYRDLRDQFAVVALRPPLLQPPEASP